MRNLHKLFYKDYFSSEKIDDKNVSFENLILKEEEKKCLILKIRKKEILDRISLIEKENNYVIRKRNEILCANVYGGFNNPNERLALVKDNHFGLKIAYPGLVTGVGINHEAKIEGEFKLGVHFDYTYGMPVVYGSSVKGVLRNWIRDLYEGPIDVLDLEMDIFEGKKRNIEAEKVRYKDKWKEKCQCDYFANLSDTCYKQLKNNRIYESYNSIYNRDIFFDAVITKADTKGRILCPDSITPHGGPDRNNPLMNPTPITFLKIAPGCTIEFRFKLENSTILKFTAKQKLKLFEDILKTVGVGAKTNVGYGQFE